MRDTVLLETGNSRYLRSVANFLSLYPTYQDFAAALIAGTLPVDFAGVNPAGCAQIGTSLNKANLLSDATAQALGLASQDPTINEALAALSEKQDKVSGATNGNFAALDSNGNLADSGHEHSDYIAASEKGAASGVATLDGNSKITPTQATARMVTVSSNTTLAATHNGCRIKASGTITITVPSSLSEGFEVEIINIGTGTVTITAASGVSLNGTAAASKTLDNKYDVAALAALTATDWSFHKGEAA